MRCTEDECEDENEEEDEDEDEDEAREFREFEKNVYVWNNE